jgi:hypothetical protein
MSLLQRLDKANLMRTLSEKQHQSRHIVLVVPTASILLLGAVVFIISSQKTHLTDLGSGSSPKDAYIGQDQVKNNISIPTRSTNGKASPSEVSPTNMDTYSSGSAVQSTTISPSQNPGKGKIPICFQNTGKLCVIRLDDPLFALLGKSISDEGLFIDGVLVKPQKVVYKVTYNTYPDEQLKDVAGKILLSTNKLFDEKSDTLTLTIGINEQYFQDLNTGGQRTFPVSRLVRSFLTMFKESPDNYIKVEQIVKGLGDWYPATE